MNTVTSKPTFTEICGKCGGSGVYRGPSPYGPQCFPCGGTGRFVYSTSREQRAKAREQAAARKARKADAAWQAFADDEANGEIVRWIEAQRGRFGFAASMYEAVRKYGSLTEGQVRAISKCIARDADREAQRAEQREQADRLATKLDTDLVGEALRRACENGLKWPKLRFQGFRFSLAGENSRNPGATYVTSSNEGTYLGKIGRDGRFSASRDCTEALAGDIARVVADPSKAAREYGLEIGKCSCCGRQLTDPSSVAMGIGPICANRFGL